MPYTPDKHNTNIGIPVHSTVKQDDKARQERRLYRTNDSKWRKIRAGQLTREPLCRACKAKGIIFPANEVDHIDGDSYNNFENNLQSLCKPCHSKKTAKENGGFGK